MQENTPITCMKKENYDEKINKQTPKNSYPSRVQVGLA